MTRATATAGRAWARVGFGVGVAASVAANVAHSYVAPAGAVGDSWHPPVGAIVAAAFWPVALVISVEVIQRVHWPAGWLWALTRWGGMSAVALIAAVISYRHLSGLMTAYGEDRLSATIGPLAVDGLMVVSSGALMAIADMARRHDSDTTATTPAPACPEASWHATPAAPPVLRWDEATGQMVEATAGDDEASVVAPATPPRAVAPRARRAPARRRGDDLSRQRGIRLARQGCDAKAIAGELGVSLRSAQRYVAAVASEPAEQTG